MLTFCHQLVISSFIYHNNWYKRLKKNSTTISLILDHDSYPKDKHYQRAKRAAENKPSSLKLSKNFNQKIKPKMFKSIFNNHEAKLNIHPVKNKTRKELKKIVTSVKSNTRLKVYIKWKTNQENWTTFT